jgi:hypothetical protein
MSLQGELFLELMRRFSEVQTSRETSRAFISSPQLARKLLHANAKI